MSKLDLLNIQISNPNIACHYMIVFPITASLEDVLSPCPYHLCLCSRQVHYYPKSSLSLPIRLQELACCTVNKGSIIWMWTILDHFPGLNNQQSRLSWVLISITNHKPQCHYITLQHQWGPLNNASKSHVLHHYNLKK